MTNLFVNVSALADTRRGGDARFGTKLALRSSVGMWLSQCPKLESSNVDAGFCSSKSLCRHHQHFKLPAIPVVGNLKTKLQAGFKMKILRNRLLGAALVAAGSLYAMHPAHALNGPSAIDIDGGPLGQLELSGGMSGYFYGQT